MLQRREQAGGNLRRLPQRVQVAREAHQPDDFPRGIAQGQLRGQTPAGAAVRIPVEFELVDDRAAGAQHLFILRGVARAQFGGENVSHMAAQQIAFAAQAAAFDQRLVEQHVTPRAIFHEEGGVRDVLEQLRDAGEHRAQRRPVRAGRSRSNCALIDGHGGVLGQDTAGGDGRIDITL